MIVVTKNRSSGRFFCIYQKKVLLRPTPPCFPQGPLRMLRSRPAAHTQRMGVNSARPFPYGVGSLRMLRSRPAVHTQRMGVFLPVLRTLFNVRLYAAFMLAYAAYKPPIKHRIIFYLQKKHPNCCICAVFVVNLHKFWNYEFYTPTCTLALLVARRNVQSERDSG